MSATHGGRRGLAGLSLDDVLGKNRNNKPTEPSQSQTPLQQQTSKDKEENNDKEDNKAWQTSKDPLRFNRADAASPTSIHSPTSDIPNPIRNNRTKATRPSTSNYQMSESDTVPISDPGLKAQISQRSMSRHGSLSIRSDPNIHGDSTESAALKPQMSRRNSRASNRSESPARERRVVFRDEEDGDSSDDNEGRVVDSTVRVLSAREAVAAQEAAEAAAAAATEEESEDSEPAKTSLMDLLDGYDDEEFEEEEEEEEEEGGLEEEEGTVEYDCCVCMVRHKGAAFIPCGHTFCRLCSRELYVSRKYCPLCNEFICEILDIF